MKPPLSPLALIASLCLAPMAALAQRNSSSDDAAGAASLLGCAACSGVLILIPVVIIVLNIILLIWVARDAKARGMDGSVLWMLLVFFTSIVGLIIYLFSRPQGNLIACPNCGNKKLEAAVRCPHCGFGVGAV